MSRVPGGDETGKVAAAAVAAAMIPPGSRLALGTGSTIEAALPMLAEIPGLLATPTSATIAGSARGAGLRLVPLAGEYDFYLDGADQVAPDGNVIKGSWGAHVKEKTLAALSNRRLLICDERKLVDKLVGPVPVAIIPFFAALYAASSKPKLDENGLAIVDVGAGEVLDSPATWDEHMCREPGVVNTGIFAAGFVDQIIVGHRDGSHRVIATARTEAR